MKGVALTSIARHAIMRHDGTQALTTQVTGAHEARVGFTCTGMVSVRDQPEIHNGFTYLCNTQLTIL